MKSERSPQNADQVQKDELLRVAANLLVAEDSDPISRRGSKYRGTKVGRGLLVAAVSGFIVLLTLGTVGILALRGDVPEPPNQAAGATASTLGDEGSSPFGPASAVEGDPQVSEEPVTTLFAGFPGRTSTIDGDWQEIVDTEMGFSIQLPADWTVSDQPVSSPPNGIQELLLAGTPTLGTVDETCTEAPAQALENMGANDVVLWLYEVSKPQFLERSIGDPVLAPSISSGRLSDCAVASSSAPEWDFMRWSDQGRSFIVVVAYGRDALSWRPTATDAMASFVPEPTG